MSCGKTREIEPLPFYCLLIHQISSVNLNQTMAEFHCQHKVIVTQIYEAPLLLNLHTFTFTTAREFHEHHCSDKESCSKTREVESFTSSSSTSTFICQFINQMHIFAIMHISSLHSHHEGVLEKWCFSPIFILTAQLIKLTCLIGINTISRCM